MDGGELDSVLKAIGWTPQELARRLNVRPASVYDWLTGRRAIPPNLERWLFVVRDNLANAPALPDGWRSRSD